MTCLDLDRARALAEGEPLEPGDAAHAAACARCARLVEQARREEATLRGALPAEPPRGLLEATLAAVRDEGRAGSGGDRRRGAGRDRPQGTSPALVIGAVLGVLLLGALLLLLQRPRRAPPAAPAPPVTSTPPRTTDPTPPRATTSPPRSASEAAPATEPTLPEPPPPASEPPPATEPDPWAEPAVEPEPEPGTEPAPPDVVVEAPPATTTEGSQLARVVRGKVECQGRTLTAGALLPADEALRAGGVAELEQAGSVALVLAPRAVVRLRSDAATTVVALERGRLLLRSAGDRRWALHTDEGRAEPLGTTLLALREGTRTRLSTVEGLVRVTPAAGDALDLRPGFEAELARGRPLEARPLAAPARALAWLPDDRRPAPPAAPELLAVHGFEDGRGRWTKGEPRPGGARGSRACLRGAPGAEDYAVSVELESLAGVVTIDPDLWLEASVRVDRRAKVVLQVWDHDRKENLALSATVEPGAWATLCGPLRAFTGPGGEPRGPVVRGGKGTCVTVFAGEPGEALELLVDDVRFWRQP